MKNRDMAELAARNLRESVLRNSLTTLGITVGVASLVAMLSLGVGLQNMATARLSRTGLFDAIFVSPRPNNPPLGRLEQPRVALVPSLLSASIRTRATKSKLCPKSPRSIPKSASPPKFTTTGILTTRSSQA